MSRVLHGSPVFFFILESTFHFSGGRFSLLPEFLITVQILQYVRKVAAIISSLLYSPHDFWFFRLSLERVVVSGLSVGYVKG